MSKVKPPKTKGIPNKHLHARTSFLYQSATYLTLQTCSKSFVDSVSADNAKAEGRISCMQTLSPLALQLGSDLQQVSRKGQLRLSLDLKRSMCKSCNTILVPGSTATQSIENRSKGAKKPWADVLVIKCNLCGSQKRFPTGATRPIAKSKRKPIPSEAPSGAVSDFTAQSGSEVVSPNDLTSIDD